jgi:4-hydroxybenzoate polyprenyltransferase
MPARSAFRTWLQLFRAPNLFTAPGDPLAGYLLANSGAGLDGTLPLVVCACLLFYGAGLLLNDLSDLEEDRRERPQRPLPSGAAAPSRVLAVLIALFAAGLVLCWFAGGAKALLMSAGLIVAIAAYNLWTKHWPVIGALNMGACRSLSVLVGACAGPLPFTQLAGASALLVGLYIAAVTHLARHETKAHVPALARLLPLLVMSVIVFGVHRFSSMSPSAEPAIFFFVVAWLWALWLAIRMFRLRTPIPPIIGSHIRILLLLQAGLCWIGEPYEYRRWAAAILAVFIPLSYFAAKKFYAS